MSDSELDYCLAILKALGITKVEYILSGGGDEGSADFDRLTDRNGQQHNTLPSITIGITDHGSVISLDERLVDVVAQIPEGDWCNNEGGHGTVILRPQDLPSAGEPLGDCDQFSLSRLHKSSQKFRRSPPPCALPRI